MGFRTVVILSNDSNWDQDPDLGLKIQRAMHLRQTFDHGRVVECTHADTQTIGIIDSLDFTPLAYDSWTRNETPQEVELKMIKAAAEKLGYRLVKKP